MKILITGVAGFIGFNLAKKLSKKYEVEGIDNLNNYYSVDLKKKRIQLLKKTGKFKFYKLDISDNRKLKNFLRNKKFDFVIHLAAQVGVRYCTIKPQEYIKSNIIGFFNLLNNLNYVRIKKIIYASSSSVYGDKKKFPINETENLYPKNIYGLSKKFNEEIVNNYIHKTQFIGLRFFTVYGEWGRPDMFFIKILKTIYNNKKFYLHNNGNHYRDFTYIKDVVLIIEKLIKKKLKSNHEIFNVCSNEPIKISNLINYIEKFYGKIKKEKIPLNNLEMLKTHGNNKKVKKILKYNKFYSIEYGLKQTISWFNLYYNKIKF